MTLPRFCLYSCRFFFFQAEDGIRDRNVTGVQTCALPISDPRRPCRLRTLPERRLRPDALAAAGDAREAGRRTARRGTDGRPLPLRDGHRRAEIGRASCRERGEIWGVGAPLKKARDYVARR